MTLHAVPPPAPCECEPRHINGTSMFCACSCHHAPALTEATLLAGVRAIYRGQEIPERFRQVRKVDR